MESKRCFKRISVSTHCVSQLLFIYLFIYLFHVVHDGNILRNTPMMSCDGAFQLLKCNKLHATPLSLDLPSNIFHQPLQTAIHTTIPSTELTASNVT